MKKKFTFLIAALMLLAMFIPSITAVGQTRAEVVAYTLDGTQTGGDNGYATESNITQNSVTWKVTGNTTLSPWRLGGKSLSSVDRPIYSTSALSDNITKVIVTTGTTNATSVNAVKLVVSSNSDFSNATTLTENWVTSNEITFNRPTDADWSNMYFKIIYNITVSGTSNKYAEFVKAEFYKESSTPVPSMSVSTNTIAFGDNPINPSTPYTETFDVTFSDLTQNLTVTGFSGISVSPTTINYNGTSPQTVTVTYNPTAVGSISGNITVSNTDDGLSQTIAVTGSAYDPSNVDTYERYTGVLVEGDYVICANAEVAMKNVISSNRFANETVTVTNDAISNPDASIIWHIAPEGAYFTMYNAAVGKYAAGTTSNNQGALIDNVTDYALWNISYSYSNYTVICYGRDASNNKYLRRNGNYGWGTYANGTGNVPTFYKKVVANQVAMPTFSPAEGTYYAAQSVELSCATSGATIYYTTDGSTPTTSSTAYSTAIPVSATTTIKAFAVATGMADSDVATATYTIELPLSTMDEIYARATEVGNTATTVRIAFDNWVVSAANSSSHTFVTDGTKGFMIYASNHGFAAGDILSGTVECSLQLYNGAAEITNLTSTTSGLTVTSGGSVTVANIAMADLTGINTGALVSYDDLTCSEETSGNYTNYYLTDGTTTIQAYHTIIGSGNLSGLLEDGKNYNITGVYCQNNNTKRVNPRGATDIEEVVPAPVSYYYSINGTLSAEHTCAVGSTKTLDACPDLYSDFTFVGWTTDADDVSQRLTEYTFPDSEPVTFYAVYEHPSASASLTKDTYIDVYNKITNISDLTDGSYLIIYELTNTGTGYGLVFDGNSYSLDSPHNNYEVEIDDNTIVSSSTIDASSFMIAAKTGGYSIRATTWLYIGADDYNNGLRIYSEDIFTNQISFDSEGALISIAFDQGSVILRYNGDSSQDRFRYYKDSSSIDTHVQLYKRNRIYYSIDYYTRVYNETATGDMAIIGPSIIPNGKILDMGNYYLDYRKGPYLMIEEGGQLINKDELKVEMQKVINKPEGVWGQNDNTGWYALSTPTGGDKIGDITNFTHDDYDFFKYAENFGWYNIDEEGDYLDWIDEGEGFLYARSESAVLAFRGETLVDDVNLTNLSYTSSRGSLAGLHCIGNPYTHNIYKGVGITGDMTANYYALNEATGAWISTTDATAIVPTQAILVFVNKTDGTAAIHMTSDNSAPSKKANNDYIKFNVANSQYEDVAYAWFDKGEGLKKINHRNSDVPMIYIPQNDVNYSIAYMSDNTEMFNLNFKAMTAGKYTLSISEKGDFSYLHIYDRLTGEDVDMLLDSYTFIGSPADTEARFIVRLSYNAGNGTEESFAFQNGTDVIVNGNGELQVFDLTGRMVMNTMVNGIQAVNMPQGVYVFRMIGESVMTQKIVVR